MACIAGHFHLTSTMESTIQLSFQLADQDQKDLLIAQLSELGFDAFEETETGLHAFTPLDSFEEAAVKELLKDQPYTQTTIAKQNWNQLWESNFEPVQVEDFVGIRAGFHQAMEGVIHEIVITPKMSFGTGHHATTYLVMKAMKDLDFKGKTVLDFGSGTGILAILAEKLGAQSVLAIDNDDWCIENSLENLAINQTKIIRVEKADSAALLDQFDLILANINKHIILANMEHLGKALSTGGTILLSGLLVEDEPDILAACAKNGWKHLFTNTRNCWIVLGMAR
jgi:ribosomal protein L11 methyltransferase